MRKKRLVNNAINRLNNLIVGIRFDCATNAYPRQFIINYIISNLKEMLRELVYDKQLEKEAMK